MALKDFLKSIADAIRKKNGTTAEINAQNFVAKIEEASVKERMFLNQGYNPQTIVTFEGDDFKGMSKLKSYAFYLTNGIDKIIIPDLDENGNGIKELGNTCFGDIWTVAYKDIWTQYCPNRQIIIGNGVTVIPNNSFQYCSCPKYIELRGDITEIKSNAFMYAGASSSNNPTPLTIKMVNCTTVPTLANANMFNSIKAGSKIIIPDNLYDEWINATNWNAISTNITITKESDYEASLTEVAE